MIEKTKRKRAVRRPLWQVLGLLLLILFIAGATVYFYLNTVSVNNGEDIVFLRAREGYRYNLYALDIDNEEAEARALTNYEVETSMSMFDVSPDGTWLVYSEQAGNQTKLWKLDIATGKKTLLWDCLVAPLEICWGAKLSPDGNTLLFAGEDKLLFKEGKSTKKFYDGIGILDLTDSDAIPQLLFEGDISFTYWIGNERLLFWSKEEESYFFYDIASGEIVPYEKHPNWYERNARRINVTEGGSLVTRDHYWYDGAIWEYQIVNLATDSEVSYRLSVGGGSVAWNPDNTKLLIDAIVPCEYPCPTLIYLYDTEVERADLIFEREAYGVQELVWNPDGTQFAMIMNSAKVYGYNPEGQIWIYDMESGEATPTNEVGWAVQWLNS